VPGINANLVIQRNHGERIPNVARDRSFGTIDLDNESISTVKSQKTGRFSV
jgi:hypothetical protein